MYDTCIHSLANLLAERIAYQIFQDCFCFAGLWKFPWTAFFFSRMIKWLRRSNHINVWLQWSQTLSKCIEETMVYILSIVLPQHYFYAPVAIHSKIIFKFWLRQMIKLLLFVRLCAYVWWIVSKNLSTDIMHDFRYVSVRHVRYRKLVRKNEENSKFHDVLLFTIIQWYGTVRYIFSWLKHKTDRHTFHT